MCVSLRVPVQYWALGLCVRVHARATGQCVFVCACVFPVSLRTPAAPARFRRPLPPRRHRGPTAPRLSPSAPLRRRDHDPRPGSPRALPVRRRCRRGGAVRGGPGAGRGPAGEGRAPAAAGAVPPRRHAPPRWRRQRAGGGRRGGAARLELFSAAPLRSVRHPFGYPRGPTSGRPKVSPFPLSATIGVQQPWGAAVIGRQ